MKKYYFFFFLIILFSCHHGYGQEYNYSVKLKLKPQTDKSYLATEDAQMKSLTSKHGVTIRQTMPSGPRSTPELLSYYTLTGPSSMSKESKESFIKDFLATGKFEDEVFEYGISHTNYCTNPVSVNDPDFKNSHGWALKMIQAPCAWSITTGNQNVLIGIADTDFRTTHEDFQNKFASVNGVVSGGHHHGTMVSSVAAAATNNGNGIAGIGYNSRIAAHRINHWINANGDASANGTDIEAAILNLFQMGVPIINVSWSMTGLTIQQAEQITQGGTTLVLAGGNNNLSAYHSLIATVPGVIVVSSVNSNNMHGPTGHARNQWIDICAPGWGIRVAGGNSNSHYVTENGTSVAAPFVSGTIALMLSVAPWLTPAEIENTLKSTANPIADASSFPGQLGAGRLNTYEAVYSVTPRITGPDVVCPGSTATYTLNNAPNLPVTWTGSKMTPQNNTPETSKTFTASLLSGNGWVKAWVTVNGMQVEIANKTIQVGTPTGSISAPYDLTCNCQVSQIYVNSSYKFYAENIPAGLSPNDIEWELILPPPYNSRIPMYAGYSPTISFDNSGSHTLRMRWRGPCGFSSYAVKPLDLINIYPSMVVAYPNPASDILNIEIDSEALKQSNINAKDVTFDIRLYNRLGNLLRQANTQGNTVQFNVLNLPDGIYYLHIYDEVNSMPKIQQIIVKH